MKRYIQLSTLAAIVAFLFSGTIQAQDGEPVYPIFETLTLIDNQTTFSPYKGSMNLEVQHRFAQIKDIKDIYGIYGSANTRLGFSYAITDKIVAGFGTTRSYMQQDLNWKYAILTQKTSGMPISLSYFGNAVLDARADKYFGPTEEYKFVYRMSYLNQLIIGRKIGEKIGVQMAPTFVYFNAVPEGYRNDNYSLDVGAKFQILGLSSLVFEYDQPLAQPKDVLDDAGNVTVEGKTIYPNLAFGLEIGTSTHSFRVFVSNYNNIVKNRSVAFNDRSIKDGDFQFGFNISIRF